MEEIADLNVNKKLPRVWEIDFIRGFLIILMVFDHFCYDWGFLMSNFMGHSIPYPEWFISLSSQAQDYWSADWRICIRFVVLALFFIISGISCNFSKNNLKRGIIILGLGILISAGSFILSAIIKEDFGILFGVLSTYGVSILLYWGIKKLFIHLSKDQKSWKYVSLCLGLVFVAIGLVFGFYRHVPYDSKITIENFIPIILGSRDYGADWLGLFPSIGYLFIGGFLGELLYTKTIRMKRYKFDTMANKITCPINFCGRYCGFFYILHQPVLIIIIAIILFCNGFYLTL